MAIINTIKELVPLNPLYGEELKVFLDHFSPNDPSHLADFAASLTTAGKEELQEVLETSDILQRLGKVLRLINKELEVARAQMKIRRHVEAEMQARQKEFFLREQLKAIQKELGLSKDDRTAEVDKFRKRIATLTLPEAVQKRILRSAQRPCRIRDTERHRHQHATNDQRTHWALPVYGRAQGNGSAG